MIKEGWRGRVTDLSVYLEGSATAEFPGVEYIVSGDGTIALKNLVRRECAVEERHVFCWVIAVVASAKDALSWVVQAPFQRCSRYGLLISFALRALRPCSCGSSCRWLFSVWVWISQR
jgi:hypothetical protein